MSGVGVGVAGAVTGVGVAAGVAGAAGVGASAGVGLGVAASAGEGEGEAFGDGCAAAFPRCRRWCTRLCVSGWPALSTVSPASLMPLPTVRSVACTPCLTVWPAAFAPCSTVSWAYPANVRPAVPARISANCLILVQLIEAIVLDPLPQ